MASSEPSVGNVTADGQKPIAVGKFLLKFDGDSDQIWSRVVQHLPEVTEMYEILLTALPFVGLTGAGKYKLLKDGVARAEKELIKKAGLNASMALKHAVTVPNHWAGTSGQMAKMLAQMGPLHTKLREKLRELGDDKIKTGGFAEDKNTKLMVDLRKVFDALTISLNDAVGTDEARRLIHGTSNDAGSLQTPTPIQQPDSSQLTRIINTGQSKETEEGGPELGTRKMGKRAREDEDGGGGDRSGPGGSGARKCFVGMMTAIEKQIESRSSREANQVEYLKKMASVRETEAQARLVEAQNKQIELKLRMNAN